MYPIPPKRDYKITQHAITRIDEYHWMQNREDPEVIRYLESENEYLEKELRHIQPLKELLYKEMRGRIREDDSTVPKKIGEYIYYTRTEKDKQYPIYCRKKDEPNSTEEIYLDQNALAEGHDFCSVGAISISPDQTKLAYSLDLDGYEIYTIYIKDLIENKLLPENIPGTNGSVYHHSGIEWADDNQTFFYITPDEYHRPDKLKRHKLGEDPKDDPLIFHETDDAFTLSIYKPRSEKFVMIYQYSTLEQEIRFIPSDQPDTEPRVIQHRQPNLEYYASHHDDSFLIITNHNAPNYRLVKTPVNAPGMENWQEVIPHRADTLLEHIDVFKDHIVIQERSNGLGQLRISKPDGVSDVHYVDFPDPTYEVLTDDNPDFNSHKIRIEYSSLVTPTSTVDINLRTGEWEILKKLTPQNGFDASNYITEYIHASASDGKFIPISLVYKKGFQKNSSNPALLYGYGAYGGSCEASFNRNIFSLLDRGFVYAIAHVRGGSEMGREWYDEGKHYNKRNSFTDFIACAEHLISEGYTSKDKLAIIGGSAGGLLVGASMVMRPDLFKVVLCKVPFVDVITSMSDPTLPLVTQEYDEWGNPENKKDFEYMSSYSPYDNITEAEYPHILLTSGFNDPRVAYWEPSKFLARLRDRKIGNNLAVLKTEFNAGHAGASGRYSYLWEIALDYALLINKLIDQQTSG